MSYIFTSEQNKHKYLQFYIRKRTVMHNQFAYNTVFSLKKVRIGEVLGKGNCRHKTFFPAQLLALLLSNVKTNALFELNKNKILTLLGFRIHIFLNGNHIRLCKIMPWTAHMIGRKKFTQLISCNPTAFPLITEKLNVIFCF